MAFGPAKEVCGPISVNYKIVDSC